MATAAKQPFRAIWQRIAGWQLRRRIRRALALNLRGEARDDGLDLVRISNRLEIQWRARGIHPWDRETPVGRDEGIFFDQLFRDTDAALDRLFKALPQIDIVDLKVYEPATGELMLSGTVHRGALDRARSTASVRMRLHLLGVRCCFSSRGGQS